jgi:hypothetical protein
MKVLIWIGCMILNYVIQGITSEIVSCIPAKDDGAILLVGLLNGILAAASIGFCMWLAIKLCKKLDWSRAMQKVAESRMSISEYGRQGLSEKFLEQLPNLTYEQLKSALKAAKNKGKITREQYTILLKEYSWTPGEDKRPENTKK